jgi:hypothetical protein
MRIRYRHRKGLGLSFVSCSYVGRIERQGRRFYTWSGPYGSVIGHTVGFEATLASILLLSRSRLGYTPP